MRILGFSKKWDKLEQPKFTTFRFTRRDRDWEKGEQVQIVFKPRSKDREILGIADIINKEYKSINEITEREAQLDGFYDHYEMWRFLKYPDMDTIIHKLTLRWINKRWKEK